MRCSQYYSIPRSFQKLREEENYSSMPAWKKKKITGKSAHKKERDFLDFMVEVLGSNLSGVVCERSSLEGDTRVGKLYNFFAYILRFLNSRGCLLPHVKPEYLFSYEDYILFLADQGQRMSETFTWVGKNDWHVQENSRPLKTTKEVFSSNPKVDMHFSTSSILMRGQSSGKSIHENVKTESESYINDEEEEENEEENLNQVDGNEFVHQEEVLDRATMEGRSTQAWMDVIIQIFRTLVSAAICQIPTIPDTEAVGSEDTICIDVVKSQTFIQVCETPLPPSLDSNLYSIQERALLTWLTYHYNKSRDIFLKNLNQPYASLSPRIINNFDKDLTDSLALIVVTTAYCPYIITKYFTGIFFKPDTPSKMYHNAGKLALVWRVLNIGLTVESEDIVEPNPLFMILLVTQLYRVLPTLHPLYKINFSAPLSSEIARTIHIKNENRETVHYKVIFMGDYEKCFTLKKSPTVVAAKPNTTTEINVIFHARKIKKVTATLILCGSVISPNFGKHISFHLEGEPSVLRESCKLSFTTPLYKVLCTEIPVSPPYPEPATYEIWYTTNEPTYKETADISLSVKPWCKIWNRKVSRRLFLGKCELTVNEDTETVPLRVAVACMTEKERNFWLLFRNAVMGDFLILVNIKASTSVPLLVMNAYFTNPKSISSECLCLARNKKLEANESMPLQCPFLTELCLPVRNHQLWDSMKNMFLRTLHSQEKSFWNLHFEKNIGLCLIFWFLSVDEEENVADEFIHFLQTRVLYKLKVEPPNDQYLQIPEKIEIPDVRKDGGIRLPIHVSKNAPHKMKVIIKMTSENGHEIRKFKINLSAAEEKNELFAEEGYTEEEFQEKSSRTNDKNRNQPN